MGDIQEQKPKFCTSVIIIPVVHGAQRASVLFCRKQNLKQELTAGSYAQL